MSLVKHIKVTKDFYGAVLWYHCPFDCGKTCKTVEGIRRHLPHCPLRPNKQYTYEWKGKIIFRRSKVVHREKQETDRS